MNLALTGGAGFVGRHIVAAALAGGHTLSVLTRDVPAASAALDADPLIGAAGAARVRCLLFDTTRPATLGAALTACAPDALIHLAARITGTRDELFSANLTGTGLLLHAISALPRVPRLVYMSSFAVEDTPPTHYSDSKLAAEALVSKSPHPWVILRPALIYGPRGCANTPVLVAKLRAGSMWLPRGGRARIQPVFVGDVAAACLTAAQRPEVGGKLYRLGGPEPVSVRDFRMAVRDASGGRAVIRSIPLPIFRLVARVLALAGKRGALGVAEFHGTDHVVESSAAQRDLDFRPRPLAQGLAETFGTR